MIERLLSSDLSRLSIPEGRVYLLVIQGLPDPEISLRLGMALGLVERRVAQVFRKLGVADRAQCAERFTVAFVSGATKIKRSHGIPRAVIRPRLKRKAGEP